MGAKLKTRGTRSKSRVYAIQQTWEEKTCKANQHDNENATYYHGCAIK